MEKEAAIFITLLVILVAASNVASQSRKSGHCPLPRTVSNCFNRCKNDFECSSDKKCCPNICGSTSCADSSYISYGSDLHENSKSVYCDNVKCHSGEKCVLDTKTKRNKCVRG